MLVQKELGYWRKGNCTIIPKKGSILRGEWYCENRVWVITQHRIERGDIQRWTKGYLKCVDDCTGKITKYWGKDRREGDEPFKDP